jgi:hypothetical protein
LVCVTSQTPEFVHVSDSTPRHFLCAYYTTRGLCITSVCAIIRNEKSDPKVIFRSLMVRAWLEIGMDGIPSLIRLPVRTF